MGPGLTQGPYPGQQIWDDFSSRLAKEKGVFQQQGNNNNNKKKKKKEKEDK